MRQQEILKQKQYEPMPVEHQIMIIYAASKGYLDEVPVEKVPEWEAQFHRYMDANQADLVQGDLRHERDDRRARFRPRCSRSSTRRSRTSRRSRRASPTGQATTIGTTIWRQHVRSGGASAR